MNILQEKSARRFLFSFFLIFALSLLMNLGLVLEHGRLVRQSLLLQNQAAASALLKEDVPRDVAARALTSTRTTPEGIRLLSQLGIHDGAFSQSLLPAPSGDSFALASFACLILVAALFLAAALRFLRRQERLYLNAISIVSAYADGQFGRQLPQSREGSVYRLFACVNHMAAALKAGQESEHETKEFLKATISDISHQLKTPLAALSMYNEILLEEPDKEEVVRAFAQKSNAAIERMRTLILSLLKIARLDSGTIVFQKTLCPVGELLQAAAEPLLQRASEEQITFLFPSLSSEMIYCDPVWTSEALGNLLKNALDHSLAGQEIRIFLKETALESKIEVTDSGSGIPAEDFHHIFKRFYRSKSAAGSPGFGLGLPLARSIAEGQGGRIDVVSAPGKGASFTLSLPSCKSLQNCKDKFTSL